MCDVPEITLGSMPNDGGHLLFTNEEKEEFLQKEPLAEKFIKPLLGAYEFINGESRWCLWLEGVSPAEIKAMPMVLDRVEKCKQARLLSKDKGARDLALTPTIFREQMNPEHYLLIPCVSSEKRTYIPIGFMDKETIPVMGTIILPNATLYHFGVLTSAIHMDFKYL